MLTNREEIKRSEAKKLEKFKSYFKNSEDRRRSSIPMHNSIKMSDTKRSSPLKITMPQSELRNKKYTTLEDAFA